MKIEEINQFIEKEIERLKGYYKLKSEEELTLAMALKLGEEVGELYNEILAHKGYQRKEKLNKFNKNEIGNEIADVIFVTFILSKVFNIDIEDSLNEKMKKIKERIY